MNGNGAEQKLIIHEFRQKITWSINVRYIIAILGFLLLSFSSFRGPELKAFFNFILAVFVYNITCHLISLFKKIAVTWQMALFSGFFQVLDILAISFLIYMTGWLESPFWFLYLVMIIISGFGPHFYYTASVFFIAIFSALFYIVLAYYNTGPIQAGNITLSPAELMQSVYNKAVFATVSFLLFAATIYYFSKLLNEHRAALAQKNKQLLNALEELKGIDQLKDEFITTASHELRTPLAIIRENLSLITDKIVGNVNKEQAELCDSARANIDRLTKILDNILDISKIESAPLEFKRSMVDVVLVAKKAGELLEGRAKEKNIGLEVKLPKEAFAYIDPDQIIRVFINLLDNAIKYSRVGDRVTLLLEDLGREVQCSVSDTGPGIAKENHAKIFSRFTRIPDEDGVAKERGSGLGLSICRATLELHGGKLKVESEIGKGAKFIFTLPKVKANG
ncbi:MAG: HAMP domain-containing sensor histidine kinase [bacterium]